MKEPEATPLMKRYAIMGNPTPADLGTVQAESLAGARRLVHGEWQQERTRHPGSAITGWSLKRLASVNDTWSGVIWYVTACEENEILERHALGQPQPDPDAARHVIAQMERDVYERHP